MRVRIALALLATLVATPLAARDSLGVYSEWGAFRDPETPRCYAIARPVRDTNGDWEPFASVSYWPRQRVLGQVHFRLRRAMRADARPELVIGDRRFALIGGGPDAWAADRRADAAIVAALRSGGAMRIEARAARGGVLVDRYALRGAATAIDAAALGCARLR